jgi:hypothetical protein
LPEKLRLKRVSQPGGPDLISTFTSNECEPGLTFTLCAACKHYSPASEQPIIVRHERLLNPGFCELDRSHELLDRFGYVRSALHCASQPLACRPS